MSAPQIVGILAAVFVTYLVGAIPFGLLIARSRGVDLRRVGSGNIGATNVFRALGWRLGILAFVLDMLKGFVPMTAAGRLLGRWYGDGDGTGYYLAWLAVAAAAILGHVFPVYLRFRGGKGVATSLGVLLGLSPYYAVPGLLCLALWALVLAAGRYVSLASVLAAVAFPISYVALGIARGWDPFGRQRPLLVFAVVMSLLIVYRHRSNLVRLLAGQEHKFAARSEKQDSGAAA